MKAKKKFMRDATSPSCFARSAHTPFTYNGRAEMNRPDFQVANLFREIDPRREGGWILIVKGVSVISDIDRDKSGLRNMKNQNFQFPSAGT